MILLSNRLYEFIDPCRHQRHQRTQIISGLHSSATNLMLQCGEGIPLGSFSHTTATIYLSLALVTSLGYK